MRRGRRRTVRHGEDRVEIARWRHKYYALVDEIKRRYGEVTTENIIDSMDDICPHCGQVESKHVLSEKGKKLLEDAMKDSTLLEGERRRLEDAIKSLTPKTSDRKSK